MFEDSDAIALLTESHQSLVNELAALEHLTVHLGGGPGTAALDLLSDAVAVLPTRLMKHMATEEREVYPKLVAHLGSLEVESMLEDHREIRRWIGRLVRAHAELDRRTPDLGPVRWTLYVVIGVVNLHLRKEEVAYLRFMS